MHSTTTYIDTGGLHKQQLNIFMYQFPGVVDIFKRYLPFQ